MRSPFRFGAAARTGAIVAPPRTSSSAKTTGKFRGALDPRNGTKVAPPAAENAAFQSKPRAQRVPSSAASNQTWSLGRAKEREARSDPGESAGSWATPEAAMTTTAMPSVMSFMAILRERGGGAPWDECAASRSVTSKRGPGAESLIFESSNRSRHAFHACRRRPPRRVFGRPGPCEEAILGREVVGDPTDRRADALSRRPLRGRRRHPLRRHGERRGGGPVALE